MTGFVGRRAELRELGSLLAEVRAGRRGDAGIAVALRGRRRIGKSRLVTEFITREAVPSVYFQAARRAPMGQELAQLAQAIADSDLPGAAVAEGNTPASLTAALRLLTAILPSDQASVVVLDELPWLLEAIPGGAGELQRVWDRELSAKPVLLLLLGSDLAMMEELGGYDQLFHGRAKEMLLDALNPGDIGTMTGLAGASALDAYLITGGQPLVAQEWLPGEEPAHFVSRSLERSTSALITSGLRALDSEFPPTSHPRQVLSSMGGQGERTYTGILNSLGGVIAPSSLDRALATLAHQRVVVADEPLSAKVAAKDRRWRVSDPGLRFWLAGIEPVLPDIERGRPDLALARFEASYASWRGRAIEPVVRAALERLLPDAHWPNTRRIGAWWPRSNNPEVDLVGTDAARQVAFVGTIKWRTQSPISGRDVDTLARDAAKVPGANPGTPLVGVCPAGSADSRLAQVWRAEDLLAAWPPL